MKHCPRCKVTRPLAEFHKDRTNEDGKASVCRSCCRNRDKARRAKLSDQQRAHLTNQQYRAKLTRVYGLTADEYASLLAEQDNRCALCKAPFSGLGRTAWAPVVDHDHASGRVRGVVHQFCNRNLLPGFDKLISCGATPQEVASSVVAYLDRSR